LENEKDPIKKIKDWYFQGKINRGDIIGIWHRPADINKNEIDDVTDKPWIYSHLGSFEGIKVDSLRYADFKSYRDSIKASLAGELSILHQGDFPLASRIVEYDLKNRIETKGWRLIEGITENPVAYANAVANYGPKENAFP